MFHSDFEFGALTQEIDEGGIPFGGSTRSR